nr:MAG TPA: Integrase [Caudoviricetes sp.]
MSTLYENIAGWMRQYKSLSVKPTTYDRLETSLRTLAKYRLAGMETASIRTEDLQDFIHQMVNDGYALTTIKKQYHLVTSFLKFANTEGLIPRPVYNNVRLPSQQAVHKPRRDVCGYSRSEQAALRHVLRTLKRPGYAAALLMMETGLRVGECLALTWDDILWERRALSIYKTVIRLTNRHRMEIQNGAKSFSSNRTIPLSTNALALLETLQATEGNRCNYIFHARDGLPMSYEALRYQIQIACAEAGAPYLGQHVFRHTFATNCYNRGCDVKILSKLLGHADVSVTYNVYIHLFGDALEEMRGVVG